MSVSLDRIDIGANESLFINIQGSTERSLWVSVSKSGRCFVVAPYNTKRKVFELTINGIDEVAEEERARVLGL